MKMVKTISVAAITIIITFCSCFISYGKLPEEYIDIAIFYCEAYDIDFELLNIFHTIEGNVLDVNYKSKTNSDGSYDIGIMQINSKNVPELQKKIGIVNIENPIENIKAAAFLMHRNKIWLENKGISATVFNQGMMYNNPTWCFKYLNGKIDSDHPTPLYGWKVYQLYYHN